MKIATKDLIGADLDKAVAKALGEKYNPNLTWNGLGQEFPATRYSTDWEQAGDIIDQERIGFSAEGSPENPVWCAALSYSTEVAYTTGTARRFCTMRGPTPLVASMRCFVASKLGNEIDSEIL